MQQNVQKSSDDDLAAQVGELQFAAAGVQPAPAAQFGRPYPRATFVTVISRSAFRHDTCERPSLVGFCTYGWPGSAHCSLVSRLDTTSKAPGVAAGTLDRLVAVLLDALAGAHA